MALRCGVLFGLVTLTSASDHKTVSIAPGVEMPLLSFGVSNRSLFIELGGRGLDTAWVYGDVDQQETGEAVRRSGLSRAELFVTTKIPCCPANFTTNKNGKSICNKTMDHLHAGEHIQHDFDILGLDYVDLMLIHWPCERFEDTLFVYSHMEALLKANKTRAIGVSNFNATLLEALAAKVNVKPVVNQVGFSIGGHAALETPFGRDDLSLATAKRLGITTMAYSPLGGVTKVDVLHNPVVLSVAAAHNRSAAQIALRWLVQQDIAPVTSSDSASHDIGDLQVFDFALTDAEMRRLAAIGEEVMVKIPVDPPKPAVNYQMKWADFKQEYGKSYSSSIEEEQRFQVFKVNVDFIYQMNSMNNTFELGVTRFADLTADEFGSNHMGIAKPDSMWDDLPNLGTHKYNGEPLADSIDWTTKGAVTPVKNQGQCGSCWSFSTTGSLEGAWEIATGKLVSLSEQQFVDCDKVDNGCNGGLMDNAFKFAEQNDLCTEDSYPYKAVGGTCKASSCTVGVPKGSVQGFKDVPANSKEAMMSALNLGPVSIAIEADKSIFQLYHSGVLSGLCGASLDHGVLAVGYGTEDGKDYWLVKNSWGPTWGLNGYIKLLRGKGMAGECGLLKQASYPVVKKAGGSLVV